MPRKYQKKTSQEIADVPFEPLLTQEQLSEILGFSVEWIKVQRRIGLPFYKISHFVRFRLSEVNRWLMERKAHAG